MSDRRTLKRILSGFFDLALFAVALITLSRIMREYHWRDIEAALRHIATPQILLSLLITAAGYLSLVGYDYLSFGLIRKRLPLRAVLAPSFISYAVANSAPVSVVTGGGVRYRLYAGLGLTPGEMARVAAFGVMTFVLGLFTVAGTIFIVHPIPLPENVSGRVPSVRVIGVLFLLIVAAAFWASARQRPLKLFRKQITFPPTRAMAKQVLVSAADWLLSSAALFVLMPLHTWSAWAGFLAAFLLAQITTQVIPLPGGIGVFEALVILLRPPGVSAPAMLAAAVVYRVIYYFLPLVVAAVLLVLLDRKYRAAGLASPMGTMARSTREVAPYTTALVAATTGTVLMLGSAIPPTRAVLARLNNVFPLALIELSHFLSSLIGLGLVLLAWGLAQRLRASWATAVALTIVSLPMLYLRGGHWTTVIVLLVLLALLLFGRAEFDRETEVATVGPSPAWIAAIVIAVLGTLWLGWFINQHERYSGELWWQFTLDAAEPRWLRAMVGVTVAGVAYALLRLYRPKRQG